MRSVWAIGTLMALCVCAGAQTLPGKAIPPSGTDSKGCNAVDTVAVADCLVSKPGTKIAFRLVWGRGEFAARSQSIVLRFEIQDGSNGLLKAYEFHGRTPSFAGGVRLTPDDIAGLLRAEAASDFWDQSEARNSSSEEHNGIVSVPICVGDGLTLAGVEADRRLTLVRDCPSDKTDPKVIAFSRALVQIARKHFASLAADAEFWSGL
ncbi:MAG TPA: hypothetical protein VNW15_08795 [Rhizomicrobium sp.]|nr:hypothetical protein [Rhizomicrobium sp.]